MDPVSAAGLIGSVIGITDVVARSIHKLSVLGTRYRQANLWVSALLGQLCTIKAALGQLTDLSRSEGADILRSSVEIKNALETSLDGCSILVESLEEQLDQLSTQDDGRLDARGKLSFLWRDEEVKNYLDLLDRQVNALNLLLQVIQCKSQAEQQALMQQDDSVTVIRLARECTESLNVMGDTSSNEQRTSVFSENSEKLSMRFTFDQSLLGSRVYQTATISNVRKLIRRRSNESTQPEDARDKILSTLPAARQQQPADSTDSFVPISDSRSPGHGTINSQAGYSKEQYLNIPLPSARVLSGSQKRRPIGLSRPFVRGTEEMGPVVQRYDRSILILGSSESGKTTLLKSMKLHSDGGYTRDERAAFKDIIFSNAINGMRIILQAMNDLQITLKYPINGDYAEIISRQPLQIQADTLPLSVWDAIKYLWSHFGVQNAYRRRREYQLYYDSCAYFCDAIDRIGAEHYLPTDEDMLRVRVKTTGTTRTTFMSTLGPAWSVTDVGGARPERKKWGSCFDNVECIIFTVDITCFNKVLDEDKNVSCMQESRDIFDVVINHRPFKWTAFVLLFTKCAGLEQQLQDVSVNDYFPGFTGQNTAEDFVPYIAKQFRSLKEDPNVVLEIRCADIDKGLSSMGQVAEEACDTAMQRRDNLWHNKNQ